MNHSFPPRAALAAAPRRAGAFSLVVTLIIVSMLAVVAIGFLSSMSSERVTADAFGNKSRAEQVAQAGVDSAEAILRQAFKDFPDSATVWEKQSTNSGPDVGTSVDTLHPTAPTNEGTSLYLRAMPGPIDSSQPDSTASVDNNSPNHVVSATDASDARTTFVLPLVSGAKYKPLSTKSQSVNGGVSFSKGRYPDADNFVDLNVLRYKGDMQGWIGSPPSTSTSLPLPKTTRVPWVEIKQPDAKDPNNAPVVARYAFWVEDESFRTNVNYVGNGGTGTSGSTRVRQDNNATFPTSYPLPLPYSTPTPSPDQLLNAATADLFGPFHALGDIDAAKHATNIRQLRTLYPGGLFPETTGYTHAEQLPSALSDQLRYLTTTTSAGLNLSRHGTQRVSLNGIVYPRGALTYSPKDKVDAIIQTIQFHAPNFGQRFYRSASGWNGQAFAPTNLNALTVTGDPNVTSPLHDHKLIYLNKVAANLLDYIDDDNQPTVISQTGAVVSGTFAGLIGFSSTNGASPVWAIGKEAIPYMDEAAARFRTFRPASDSSATPKYGLYVDYYIELWNMTARTIHPGELGNARVRIADPVPWVGDSSNAQSNNNCTYLFSDQTDGVSPSHSRGFPLDNGNDPGGDPHVRDIDIDISNVTFQPGVATVITTDPDWKDIITNTTVQQSNAVAFCQIVAPGKRVFTGDIPYVKNKVPATRCTLLRLPIKTYTSTNVSDYQTSVVVYNANPNGSPIGNGYFDSVEGALPVYNGGSVLSLPLPATDLKKIYGGSLHGNTNTNGLTSMTGDPRSNSEQMNCFPYTGSNDLVDHTRYYNFTWSSNGGYAGSGPDASFGSPNFNFMKPDDTSGASLMPWADYAGFQPSGSYPPTGSYAPAVIGNAPLTSIGQLGDVYDPARWTSATAGDTLTAARGGGRTFKIGQHDDLWDGDVSSASHSWASWRLADFFCADDAMLQPGLINVNGVARDDGAALRAALTGFQFQKNAPNGRGAPTLESAGALNLNSGAVTGLQAVINQIKARVVQPTGNSGDTKFGIPGYPPANSGRGPFFERGELSELPAFGRNSLPAKFPPDPGAPYAATDLSGTSMNLIEDRGREELFRRLVEMTTTRGNVFTVYAMGQAIVQSDPTKPETKRATSTQRLKVTFRLIPKSSVVAGATYTNFHPATDANGVAKQFKPADRFARPDHYDIEILSTSKGGG